MKRHWLWAVTAACALLLSGCGGESSEADGRTELVVYTAIEAEHLQAYAAAFEADNPDLKIRWMRESTGIVTAKLLAEGAGTSADAVWGLAATSMTELDRRGLLAPYAPVGADRLNRKFLDRLAGAGAG